jgi:hypothetical protein
MLAVNHCLACLALLVGGPSEREATTLNTRAFLIPFRVDAERRDQIKKLVLWVSPDKGISWEKAAQAAPTEAGFRYTAPQDGEYWFTVQTEERDGSLLPRDPMKAEPGLKVVVATGKKQSAPPPYELVKPPGLVRRGPEFSELDDLEDERDRLQDAVKDWEKRVEDLETRKKQKLQQDIDALRDKLDKLKERARALGKDEDVSRPPAAVTPCVSARAARP